MRFQFRCPLLLLSKNMYSKSNAMTQIVAEFTFLSSVFIGHCIHSLLSFLARYVNILYLLEPQLSACTPIQLELLICLSDA